VAAATRTFLYAQDGSDRTLGLQAHARSRPSSTAANGVAQDHVAALDLLASLARGFAVTLARREDADIVGSVLAGVPPAGRVPLRRRRVPIVDLVVVLNGAGSAPQLVQTLCEFKSISHFPTHALRPVGHPPLPGRRAADGDHLRRAAAHPRPARRGALRPAAWPGMPNAGASHLVLAGLRAGHRIVWRVVGRPSRPARELLAVGRARVDGAHGRALARRYPGGARAAHSPSVRRVCRARARAAPARARAEGMRTGASAAPGRPERAGRRGRLRRCIRVLPRPCHSCRPRCHRAQARRAVFGPAVAALACRQPMLCICTDALAVHALRGHAPDSVASAGAFWAGQGEPGSASGSHVAANGSPNGSSAAVCFACSCGCGGVGATGAPGPNASPPASQPGAAHPCGGGCGRDASPNAAQPGASSCAGDGNTPVEISS